MAKTGHRIRKHEMKEDSFVTLAFRAQEFVQSHQKYFVIGLAALVAVILGVWALSASERQAEQNSEQKLGEAFGLVQRNDMDGAAQVYNDVVDRYEGTRAAREALFYLGNLYFVQKKWPEAIDAFRRYLDKYSGTDPGRTAAAWAAIGDAYQAQGLQSEALDSYEHALDIKGASYLADDILLQAARSALALGDQERARGYADRLFERSGPSPDMTKMIELLALHGITYTRGF